MSDTNAILSADDSALLKGDAYVRSHDIYKEFCKMDDAGLANGARWLARDAYQNGFIEGEKDALRRLAEVEAANRWIPVSEKLPPVDTEILYVVSGDEIADPYVRRGMRCFDGNEWWWCDEQGEYEAEGNDSPHSTVKAWRPLPPAPTEAKG